MNDNHSSFVRGFILAFAGTNAEASLQELIRKMELNELYLWQIPSEFGASFEKGANAMRAFDSTNKNGAYEFVFDGTLADDKPLPL